MTQHHGQHGNDCCICNKINRDFARSVNQAQEIAALRQDKAELVEVAKHAEEQLAFVRRAHTEIKAAIAKATK